jgi:hypothetical protein
VPVANGRHVLARRRREHNYIWLARLDHRSSDQSGLPAYVQLEASTVAGPAPCIIRINADECLLAMADIRLWLLSLILNE